MNEIGALVRAARKAKNLTQEAAGKPLGMSRSTISGIETGRIAEVGIRKVMSLCASLGLQVLVGPRNKYPTLQELRKENAEKKRLRGLSHENWPGENEGKPNKGKPNW